MKIALISCSKEKRTYPCRARELYSPSTLFSLSYRYAKKYADIVYILSAKYGLVSEHAVLEPYDQTLSQMGRVQQEQWTEQVLDSLSKLCSLQEDEFIILAGENYYRDLIPHLPHCTLPLRGMPLGKRMAFLRTDLDAAAQPHSVLPAGLAETSAPPDSNLRVQLHTLFNQMPRYTWTQIGSIPFPDGIYIVFEQGEQYHGMDRIVHVGTHTSPGRLKQRLSDHFVKENHDGSIFRKNLGKAILNDQHDPYLSVWSLDTSKPDNVRYIDKTKCDNVEKQVSAYMRERLTFTAFPVASKEKRSRFEEGIISALHHAGDFGPSGQWLGRHSPEGSIQTSGLWLKQGLGTAPLTAGEFAVIQSYCGAAPSQIAVSLGKYAPLYHYLRAQTSDRVELSFIELEQILGFPLPKSAHIRCLVGSGRQPHPLQVLGECRISSCGCSSGDRRQEDRI